MLQGVVAVFQRERERERWNIMWQSVIRESASADVDLAEKY
jgi:hypothetical protein